MSSTAFLVDYFEHTPSGFSVEVFRCFGNTKAASFSYSVLSPSGLYDGGSADHLPGLLPQLHHHLDEITYKAAHDLL